MTNTPFPPSSQVSDEGRPEGMPQMTRPPITPEQIEAMRAEAMRRAVEQVQGRPQQPLTRQEFVEPQPEVEPQVVYVRRNFTVAELILVLIMAIASVSLFQTVWGVVEPNLPRIEIKSR